MKTFLVRVYSRGTQIKEYTVKACASFDDTVKPAKLIPASLNACNQVESLHNPHPRRNELYCYEAEQVS